MRDVARQRVPVRHVATSVALVRGRHAGLVRLVQADDPFHQRLRPRRAEGDVDVDGDDPVDALEDRVVVEHPAGARADAHRDHPLRLEHLVVDLAQRRGHLVRDPARDDQQVGLARRGAERLHPEARDVVAARRRSTSSRSRSRRARTCPATSTSSAPSARPSSSVVSPSARSSSVGAQLLLELRRPLGRPEQPLRLEPVVAQARRVVSHERHQFEAPLRQM